MTVVSIIKFKNNTIVLVLKTAVVLLLGYSCTEYSDNVKQLTKLEVEDPYRKYFPVIQGQRLPIVFLVKNTGDFPLRLFNVLPSCGCTTVKFPRAIAPGQSGIIKMEFNSNKNIGHVGIYTTLVANTKEKYHTFFFETNVVPNALYIKDYEEIYFEEMRDKHGFIQSAVDGDANQKGYIVDSTAERRWRSERD